MNEALINEQKLSRTAQILTALRHPLRIEILKLLDANKTMNVTAFVNIFQIEQAAVSHHLIVMKNYRILESTRRGKNTDYSIVKGKLEKIEKAVKLLTD